MENFDVAELQSLSASEEVVEAAAQSAASYHC